MSVTVFRILSISLIAFPALMVGCTQQSGVADGSTPFDPHQPLRIVTTTGMVTDIVSQVVGPRGQVTALMGAGVDPHLYKPTRNDVRKLLDCDLAFASGLMLEGRLDESLNQLQRGGHHMFLVTSKLDMARLRKPSEFSGHYDPHVWMDVRLWSECVEAVADELARLDPTSARDYQERATKYREELAELDLYVEQVIASIPEEHRILVTAHDAFGYFAERYGMTVRSVQGISTESEAGIHDVNALVDFLCERKLPALFVESSVNSKNLEAVLEGCRSRGVNVQLGGMLYSDAMGDVGTYEGTYIGMIDANATRIARALGGKAPERGWRSRLTVDARPSENSLSPR